MHRPGLPIKPTTFQLVETLLHFLGASCLHKEIKVVTVMAAQTHRCAVVKVQSA